MKCTLLCLSFGLAVNLCVTLWSVEEKNLNIYNNNANTICSLSSQPEPILNHIVSYISFANNTFENEDHFQKRLFNRESRPCIYTRDYPECKLTKKKCLKITNFSSLLLQEEKKIKTHSLYEQKVDNFLIQSRGYYTKENKVSMFTVSANKKWIIALVSDPNRLCVISLDDPKKIEEYSLEEYALASDKFFVKDWESTTSAFTLIEPIQKMTISNNGKKIAFTTGTKLYYMNVQEERPRFKAIKECITWDILLITFKGDELVLAYDSIYPYRKNLTLQDKWRDEKQCLLKILKSIYKENKYDVSFLNQLQNKNIVEIQQHFTELYEKLPLYFEYIEFENSYQKKEKDSLWTLQKYFLLKGVCKELFPRKKSK